jgi:hypothetical protein
MNQVTVDRTNDGVSVQIKSEEVKNSNWLAQPLGKNVVIAMEATSQTTVGRADPKLLFGFLKQLIEMKFTGSLNGYWEGAAKKLFFDKGRIVFATSNQMDDRLGEVIYREGIISLDELLNSAVHVTKEKKFGQVLIELGLFSHLELWHALQSQMYVIARSFFLQNMISYEVVNGTVSPIEIPNEVSSLDILHELTSFSSMFKDFEISLIEDSSIQIAKDFAVKSEVKEGTFRHDFLTLIETEKKLANVKKASRLGTTNTIAELFILYNTGALEFSKMNSRKSVGAGFGKVKNILDAYDMLRPTLIKGYVDGRVKPPISDIKKALHALEFGSSRSIDISDNLEIRHSSIENIFAMLHAYPERIDLIVSLLTNYVNFVILSAIDGLPGEQGMQVKQNYKSLFK